MSITPAEIIFNYLKYQENINSCSPLTIKAYSIDLAQAFNKKLNIVCEYNKIWELVRASLSQWSHLSLASRNRKMATLKSFFSWLYEQKLLDTNYASQLVCPKVPRKIPHFISVDEVISILNNIAKQITLATEPKKLSLLQKQKTLFLLLYGGGLRISEACQIKWKDMSLNEKKVLIKGKGGKERYSILPDFCIEHLKKVELICKAEKHIYVFGEKPLHTRIGYDYIKNLGLTAELMNPLHPHSLRHSFATHLLASGANLRTLQKLLGHESLQATEKYTHLSVDHLARLIEKTHPLNKLKISS